MDALSKLQLDTITAITKAKTNFKKSPKERITASYVEARLQLLETHWSSFYATHRKIIEDVQRDELLKSDYESQDKYGATEDLYIEFKCELKEALRRTQKSEPSNADSRSTSKSMYDTNVSSVKLPQISLSMFSGRYTEYSSFRDLFKSLIHNNSSLDDVQKLHYLKSHLTGEAEQLLRHIPITGDNYSICWSKLESRYENKRYLANSILTRFMNQKSINTQTSSALKELLDTSNECLNALKQLDINVDEWDIIVIFILSSKLDTETRKQWETKISETSEHLPTWGQFQEFLEQKFRALEFLDPRVSKNISKVMNQKSINTQTSSALKELLDTSNECLNALKQLDINVDEWDIIVIFILSSKLDTETRKQWETKISETSEHLPTWGQFQEFLEQKFRALEFLDPRVSKNISKVTHKSLHVTTITCSYCKDAHKLFNCKKFAKDDVEARRNFVQTQGFCFNCLGSGHSVIACRLTARCRICHRKHHSLLHQSNFSPKPVDNKENSDQSIGAKAVSTVAISQSDSTQNITNCFSQSPSHILLATALVNIEARTGTYITLRSLLDQGSQASFITESAVQELGLKKNACTSYVSVLGSNASPMVVSKHIVQLKLQSLYDSSFVIRVTAHVLNKLTNFLPSQKVAVQLWSQLSQLSLADPTFDTPNKVDMLLGAKVYSQILKEGVVKDPSSLLIAQNTSLGWIISGETDNGDGEFPVSYHTNILLNMHVSIEDNEMLRKFWEIESEPSTIHDKKFFTKEEQKCEKIYTNTTKRDPSGRYIVRLPFKEDGPTCSKGNSKEVATKRLLALERKLSRNIDLKKQYSDVFTEYLTLGHMEMVPSHERDKSEVFYLPHLCVIRNDKSTTPVRIVFDASCPGSNGVSLNNDLMIGPALQADLRHIIMRWRTHPICITSDIAKMYRQVIVAEEDVDFQRVLWRTDTNSEIEHYRLLRVTFGTSSAPYLAIRTLQQLAYDEGAHYPQASEKVLTDFYVDDLMTGCQDEAEGKQLYLDMQYLLKKGGFELRKWTSNNEKLMEWMKEKELTNEASNEVTAIEAKDVVAAAQESEKENTRLVIKTDKEMKILGLTWNRQNDVFMYTIQLPSQDVPITKRKVISDISRLFDPLGWLAPIIIKAKILIQKLWISGIQWDEELTPQLLAEWAAYRDDLSSLSSFEMPRWIKTRHDDICVQLHGFCDASCEAYSAVVYIRVTDREKNIHVQLVSSKTKVAPVKQISIPRLELCGAVLLSRLIMEISRILRISNHNIYAWTDSSVVLAWLSSHPSRWKVFVANRVSEILTTMNRSQWSHVQSKENPADCASRGVMPSDLHKIQIWKNGPSWLKEQDFDDNGEWNKAYETDMEEKPAKVCQALMTTNDDSIWLRFSSLRRLVRVMAWCRRFKLHKSITFPQWLTRNELQEILGICIKQYQSQSFYEEIEYLTKKGTVNKNSKLTSLNPFLDATDLLRVGGRLDRAAVNENRRHPIILPAKSHLTNLVIADAHEKTLHGGPQIMINYIRSKYWVIDAKNQVKRYIRTCVKCIRFAACNREQLMGQLPAARVTPARAFLQTGVDYAGPINIRASKGRGHRAYKGYICLFICMVTRAIHLEVVSDLTAQGFIAAFKRFVARRGHCVKLFSDNGTNFIGAARELRALLAEERSGLVPEIANWLSSNGTEWHFIPPHSPNFGGLWEAGVKSTKHHLRRVIGTSTLTFEEMSTVLAQVEACLNSRPISSLSSSADDPMPLTPGHFLVGEPLLLVPDINFINSNISSLKRWQLTQRMVQDFWRKWSQEYLTQFLHRYKWSLQTTEPSVGEVVLVKEDDLPPARWLYGVITAKHPGLDNITRVVSIRCKGAVFKRPVSKLCILPVTK